MAPNLIKKILGDGISSALGRDDKESVIGVDIGSSAVKIVQLRKKNGKAILETYGALAIGPYGKLQVGQSVNLSVDVLSQAISDLLREANTTTKNGAISIPSSASLIFMISLPSSIAEDQLASIVPIEARKYIPVPISEVTLDWWMIPRQAESMNEEDADGKLPESKTEILVVAIHNDTLIKYRDILQKTDIHSNFLRWKFFLLYGLLLGTSFFLYF